ncbi:translation initiation factor IF-2-like [Apus apus]|uniref:translation initiation factor IF-2-like n=1 Tax=Apus apus TaxID=8895 RepID=UPI0021F8171C|nr:translation initiation factor IF-2-like [Apus apus]
MPGGDETLELQGVDVAHTRVGGLCRGRGLTAVRQVSGPVPELVLGGDRVAGIAVPGGSRSLEGGARRHRHLIGIAFSAGAAASSPPSPARSPRPGPDPAALIPQPCPCRPGPRAAGGAAPGEGPPSPAASRGLRLLPGVPGAGTRLSRLGHGGGHVGGPQSEPPRAGGLGAGFPSPAVLTRRWPAAGGGLSPPPPAQLCPIGGGGRTPLGLPGAPAGDLGARAGAAASGGGSGAAARPRALGGTCWCCCGAGAGDGLGRGGKEKVLGRSLVVLSVFSLLFSGGPERLLPSLPREASAASPPRPWLLREGQGCTQLLGRLQLTLSFLAGLASVTLHIHPSQPEALEKPWLEQVSLLERRRCSNLWRSVQESLWWKMGPGFYRRKWIGCCHGTV